MSERRYHVGNLRSRLLAEAREMLEAGGLKTMNLRALAARAGIAAGSMYHHYDSKTALLAELAAGGFLELRRELDAADRAAVRGGRLRGWARCYFHFAERSPALFGLMFDPEIAGQPAVAEARGEALAVLRRVVDEVAAAQPDIPPVDQIVLAVWAASHGAAVLAASEPQRSELIDEVIVGLEALFRPRA
jgi:AcrR family transcriptional regulator